MDQYELPASLGRYVIERPIGSGGMGTIFLAHDRQLGRAVAIKTVSARACASLSAVERIRREALALARLNHPSIVRIFDADGTGGEFFIVMELLAGKSLEERTLDAESGDSPQDAAPIDPKEFLQIFTPLADALVAVHGAGLLHRDIKPANIMAGVPERGAVLTDFGIALLEDQAALTRQGTLLGTYRYMAPELIADAKAGPLSDVFGLGATMYEYATRKLLFGDIPGEALLYMRTKRELPPVASCVPGIPDSIAAIIDRAVRLDPAARQPSARELHRALVRGGRDLARGDGAADPSPRRPRATTVLDVERPYPPLPETTPMATLGGVVQSGRFAAVLVVLGLAAAGWWTFSRSAVSRSAQSSRSTGNPIGSYPVPAEGSLPPAERPIALCKPGEGALYPVLASTGNSMLAAWPDAAGQVRLRWSGDLGRSWRTPAADRGLGCSRAWPIAMVGCAGRFFFLYTKYLKPGQISLLAAAASAEASAWTSPANLGLIAEDSNIALAASGPGDPSDRMLAAWREVTGKDQPQETRLRLAWGDAARARWSESDLIHAPAISVDGPAAVVTPREGAVVWRWLEPHELIGELHISRSSGPGGSWSRAPRNGFPGSGVERCQPSLCSDGETIYAAWASAGLEAHRPHILGISTSGLRKLNFEHLFPDAAEGTDWPPVMVARRGKIWAAWISTAPRMLTWTTSRDGGRNWEPAKPYAPALPAANSQGLSVDSSGRAWVCWGTTNQQVHAMPLP